MAEFTSANLLEYAKARYGEAVLRQAIQGAGGDTGLADIELQKIAESVIGRVRSAAQASGVGWPVVVTANVLQRALELFRWRTLAGYELVSTDLRKTGEAAERYFDDLAESAEAWGIDSTADVGPAIPLAARDRAGDALISSIENRRNLLDELKDGGWDWVA